MTRALLIFAAILFATAPVAAGDYEDGIEAYDGADYVSAFQHLKKAADNGNQHAQALVGFMYANGQGVPIDFVSAYIWYELSAAQGNDNAAKNRSSIESKLTSEQIAEAKRRVGEWKTSD